MYKIVLTLSKFSICCTYYRIFAISILFRRVYHATQCIIVATGLAFTIGTVFQCTPVVAFWSTEIESASCIAQKPWWMSFSLINILLDILLLVLPIPSTWKLHMSLQEKIGICLIYCTGLFATATSIVRLTTLEAGASNPDSTCKLPYLPRLQLLLRRNSFSFVGGPIPATKWSVIEANSAIIVGCLPALRQSFIYSFSRLLRTSKRSTLHSGSPPVSTARSNPRLYVNGNKGETSRHWIELPESQGIGNMGHANRASVTECRTQVRVDASSNASNTSREAIIQKTQEWEVTSESCEELPKV